jgi:hypothetical protein
VLSIAAQGASSRPARSPRGRSETLGTAHGDEAVFRLRGIMRPSPAGPTSLDLTQSVGSTTAVDAHVGGHRRSGR